VSSLRLVLVTGSRDWERRDIIRERLVRLPEGVEILHGGARGADTMAAEIARSLGIPERAVLPDWDNEGSRAGVLRNVAMLEEEPDLVLAFWDRLSSGTAHTIREARRRGIPVEVFTA
jgi:YspA, cpYpsA-related SLOG family